MFFIFMAGKNVLYCSAILRHKMQMKTRLEVTVDQQRFSSTNGNQGAVPVP
jgi:hypothetical protein